MIGLDDSLCQREYNKCKKRKRCERFMHEPDDGLIWYTDYYGYYHAQQQDCPNFIQRENDKE